MSTTRESQFNIVDGPSRDTLFDACKYAYDKKTEIFVNFKAAKGYTQHPDSPKCAYIPLELSGITIANISHEDGSGHKFNLSGYCHTKEFSRVGFKAYYDTKRREGYIVFK